MTCTYRNKWKKIDVHFQSVAENNWKSPGEHDWCVTTPKNLISTGLTVRLETVSWDLQFTVRHKKTKKQILQIYLATAIVSSASAFPICL